MSNRLRENKDKILNSVSESTVFKVLDKIGRRKLTPRFPNGNFNAQTYFAIRLPVWRGLLVKFFPGDGMKKRFQQSLIFVPQRLDVGLAKSCLL